MEFVDAAHRPRAAHLTIAVGCCNRWPTTARQPVIGHSAVRARLLSRPAFGSERGAQQDARDNGPCDACLFLITRTILKCLGMAGISAFGDLPRRRRCRETYCVAGHVGLELRNVVANYLFEKPHRFSVDSAEFRPQRLFAFELRRCGHAARLDLGCRQSFLAGC